MPPKQGFRERPANTFCEGVFRTAPLLLVGRCHPSVSEPLEEARRRRVRRGRGKRPKGQHAGGGCEHSGSWQRAACGSHRLPCGRHGVTWDAARSGHATELERMRKGDRSGSSQPWQRGTNGREGSDDAEGPGPWARSAAAERAGPGPGRPRSWLCQCVLRGLRQLI